MKAKQRVVESRAAEFDVAAFLESEGPGRTMVKCRRGSVVFSQGDRANDVRYLQKGAVKLSVFSRIGKEAVVALLGPGDFFGEAALAGQPVRLATATAVAASTLLVIEKQAMVRLLSTESAFAGRFLTDMLTRNLGIEGDLIDQLFNTSEKRLARTLLLLTRYGDAHPPLAVPKVSQETLAEMIGATRSRVNFFLNKFRKLGLIEYNDGLKIHNSLLSIVLQD